MSWAFNARGTLEECLARLESDKPPDDPTNAHQFEVMKAVVKDELDHYGPGSTEMSIAASGHAPGKDGGDRSFSIWVSGKAVPRTAKKAEAPEEPPAPPAPPEEPPTVEEPTHRGRRR